MPAYPLPPWLHAPDTVGPFVQAQRLRAEMDMQQQRLAQEERNAAIAAQVRKEQSERESLLEQQRIEVSKAQHQQEAALKMQELEQAKAKIEQASQLAARKYAAMQQYQQRVQAGEDPTRTLLELGPAMGESGGAIGAALRVSAAANRPPPGLPQFGTDPSGNPYMFTPATGRAQYAPRRSEGLTQNQMLNAKMRMKSELLKQMPKGVDLELTPEEKQLKKQIRDQIKKADDDINDLIKKGARHDDLIPVERDGKKGFIHKDDLGAAQDEVDDEGEPVYKFAGGDVPDVSPEGTEDDNTEDV